jgi:methylase of polypeptide subunit release factors
MTILDPTCGTGAFLLAALRILEPLYELCVARLQLSSLNDRRSLSASIIANNLYGVDIMEEAVEVCRMRLLLKVLAHCDRFEDCGIVPDVSCTIRVGNALAGSIHEKNIVEQGGFDVILGNPPYIEYSKVRRDYAEYRYESCGNLYAAFLERSLVHCHAGRSYIGLIVPLSICSGERFRQLRAILVENTSSLWLSNFEIFPSRLFDGAFQRLSILIAKSGMAARGVPHSIYVTRIHRWYAAERLHLLPLIAYTPMQLAPRSGVFPKLASSLHEAILHKILEMARDSCIAAALSQRKTEHFVYYQEATNYWTKATCYVPFYRKNGVVMVPSHGRFLFFHDEITARTVMALMNSSLFYLWFATCSDGFHLSHVLVKEFPVAQELYTVRHLPQLALQLEEDVKRYARMSTRNTKTHRIEIEEYRMGQSKVLLDEIDTVLADYYHFTDDELEFIIHYDSKYRLGRENCQRKV